MDKHSMPITFPKQEEPMAFLLTMFSVISKAGADREVVQVDGKLTIRQRNPDEIVTLKQDISQLEGRVFDWFDQRQSFAPLELDAEESKLLRYCAHAAYYFITETASRTPVDQAFIRFYEHYFKP